MQQNARAEVLPLSSIFAQKKDHIRIELVNIIQDLCLNIVATQHHYHNYTCLQIIKLIDIWLRKLFYS